MYCALRYIAVGFLFAALGMIGVPSAHAQWSGTLSIGAEATNNVQELDTIAPDHMLMPAFELDYELHPSGVSRITLSGSISPEYYYVNPGLSFNETMIGATGVFYLSNQNAITALRASEGSEEEMLLPTRTSEMLQQQEGFSGSSFSPPAFRPALYQTDSVSKSDSLVDVAVSALYTLSGELDSTDISSNGISKARASEFEDLRDSISDVLSTAADLLDSIGYSESTVEVLKTELSNLRSPLAALMPHTKPFHTEPALLDSAIAALAAAKPQADFFPTPAAPPAITSAATKSSQPNPLVALLNETKETSAPLAPRLTLVSSDVRLRDFGYGDVDVYQDAEDSDATTLATTLTIPVAYTNHSGIHYSPADTLLFGGNFGGNPNDSRELTFGAALEGLTSTNVSLRGSYDYTRTAYPFDSVYTNTENRFGLFSRITVGSFVLFPEASLGFRDYLTPLTVVDTLSPQVIRTGPRGKKDTIPAKLKTLTAGNTFSQYTYGMGIANIIGSGWVLGVLADFTNNPNLRAYVTTAALSKPGKAKAVRAAVQIADDEYTYNLNRYTIFSESRIVGDLDFGVDFSIEHRVYGSEVGPKGNTVPGGQGRTEDCRFLNTSLSRIFPFENRLLGVFDALSIEGLWELANVTSTEALYNYSESNFKLTATLGF